MDSFIICNLCSKPAQPNIFCEACKSTRYCSNECKQSDISKHDPLCENIKLTNINKLKNWFDSRSHSLTIEIDKVLYLGKRHIILNCNIETDEYCIYEGSMKLRSLYVGINNLNMYDQALEDPNKYFLYLYDGKLNTIVPMILNIK